jgi:hypothetical protein
MSILAGEKFELRLIKSSDLSLHEECEDNRYNKLIERFKEEKVLYNPLIVGEYQDKFILIDGANRYEALSRIGCKAILAQLVNYKSSKVRLKSWYHFVNSMTMDDLKDYLISHSLEYKEWNVKKKFNKINRVGVISKNGEAICIKFSKDFEEMMKSICALNKYYETEFNYIRIDSDADLSDINGLSPNEGLLFVYPDFQKEHIVKISQLSQKLPAGITRHLIPNRVLRIKYEIDELKSDNNLEKRNDELNKLIENKVESKKVRLYKEPILIFDE